MHTYDTASEKGHCMGLRSFAPRGPARFINWLLKIDSISKASYRLRSTLHWLPYLVMAMHFCGTASQHWLEYSAPKEHRPIDETVSQESNANTESLVDC
jgi:hypothetical protein